MFLGFLDLDDSSYRWFAVFIVTMAAIIILVIVAAIYSSKDTQKMVAECESKGGVMLTYTPYKRATRYTCVKKDAIIELNSN